MPAATPARPAAASRGASTASLSTVPSPDALRVFQVALEDDGSPGDAAVRAAAPLWPVRDAC
jgi:hypothetical protein